MSIGSAFQWPQYPTAPGGRPAGQQGHGRRRIDRQQRRQRPLRGRRARRRREGHRHRVVRQHATNAAGLHGAARRTSRSAIAHATGAPAAPTSGSLPLARTGTPTTADDGCTALPAGQPDRPGRADPPRHLQLLREGLQRADRRRGGVVLYNNAAGRISPTVAGTPAITIPVVAITAADGTAINNALVAGPQTLTWTDQRRHVPERDRRPDLELQLLRPLAGPR